MIKARQLMTDKINEEALLALKIAFSYMPKAIEVTKYEYGEIDPDNTPNSSY
jgi:hypothetical protein